MTLENKKLSIRIPAFGKTGTTNDFTTSYFTGFVPYPSSDQAQTNLDTKNSYVISSYVGYDFNETMKSGRQKIYGSNGSFTAMD